METFSKRHGAAAGGSASPVLVGGLAKPALPAAAAEASGGV